jgi:hypothetical protein
MQTRDNQCSNEKISALAGLFAGIAGIALGCIFLIFALPSLGRLGEFDRFFSQAAGGFLIILLAIVGIFAAVRVWPSHKAERALLFIWGLFSLTLFAALSAYKEWTACAIVVAMIGIAWAAMRRPKNGVQMLFLFIGLFGFPLSQATITMLPYGWKAWSLSGVLFIYSSLLLAFPGFFCSLPSLLGAGNWKRGQRLSAFLSLALIILAVSALAHLPGPAGPGTIGTLDNYGQSANGTIIQKEPEDCHCHDDNTTLREDGNLKDELRAVILSPGDVRTFAYGDRILFSAASCGTQPLSFLWRSSRDGIIGVNQSFQKDNLSLGWHNITLAVTNKNGTEDRAYVEIGISKSWVCGQVSPRPKYYPLDTPCQDTWPDAPDRCQDWEVCHPGLDWIVAESVDCCDGSPIPGSACSDACNRSGGDRKKCRGIFIINSFGPAARYMKGYALFKACCSGYPECTRLCGSSMTGTCTFLEGYNENVSRLSCRPGESGASAWRSDTNMSENSATMDLLPTHATVNILQTGVCSDYSAALTTMLRKAGYNRSEAFSTSSSAFDLPLVGDHPGHAYNLVLLPGDSQYHIVDTTGNGDGINLGGMPGYFRFTGCFLGMPSQIRIMDWWTGYCSKISPYSDNDAGTFQTPDKTNICGCSKEVKRLYE